MTTARGRDQRHGDLAAQLSGLSREEALAHLTSREVVLDWPGRIETQAGGIALVRTTANLIVRFCPRLTLSPRSALAGQIRDLLTQIDHEADPFASPDKDAVRVHVGGGTAAADVTGSSDGWLALVSGTGEDLAELVDTPNVLGAHAAAAFVASETFKHALPVRGEFAWHAPKTAYSVFEYGAPTRDAPGLGAVRLESTPLLAGAGAVGQACVDVLVSAQTTGMLRVVDRGFVDDETNLNRSVIAIESDLDGPTPKVGLIERRAEGSGLQILPHRGELSDLVGQIERGEIEWPEVVASALDNADARRELQGLWSDFVFEGATGDTMAQVFRHAFGEALACLRCLHSLPAPTGNYEKTMAERTGLTTAEIAEALQDPTAILTKEAAAAAPDEVKSIAAAHEGRDICGYLREIERYFAITTKEPVLLSISFASYLAGVFLASELLKHFAGIESVLPGRYQIDSTVNLEPERPFPQNKEPDCYCVQRADTIVEYRATMRRCAVPIPPAPAARATDRTA